MLLLLNRTVLIYCIIIIAMRLMGKRQLGELQPSELVSTILISNLASIPIESPDIPFLNSVIPVLLIVCLEILLSALTTKSRALEMLISGHQKIIIRNGKIDQTMLKELRFTVDDLLCALRMKEVFDLNEVALALVETNGSISIFKNESATPLTLGFLGVPSSHQQPMMPVIVDGNFDANALRCCEVQKHWVLQVLQQANLQQHDVLLMLCNNQKKYQIVQRNNLSQNSS
ncbi:MAG: DUF421 domain-containing protein [Pygmaiobacter sp.]